MKRFIHAAVLFLASCDRVLGLEDAHIDPDLQGDGGAGANAPIGGSGGAMSNDGGSATDGGHDHAGGSDGGSAGDGGGTSAPTPCVDYCNEVMQSCTGEFAVYGSMDSCLGICAHLPEGQDGDTSGNSVFCRLHHAAFASVDAPFYCPIAGPTGNGTCGSACDALCGAAEAICTGSDAQWSTTTACEEECATLSDLGTYSADPEQDMYEGGHVQCRVFHLANAAVADADIHCPHVGGAAPCVPETK
ncbi:MAG: hypothetical protein HOW73_22960 [Polyangiaceae bacterium]|nr:hypothetical protein [Polyangiaceae bacterium]